jgi:hypothetical protein
VRGNESRRRRVGGVCVGVGVGVSGTREVAGRRAAVSLSPSSCPSSHQLLFYFTQWTRGSLALTRKEMRLCGKGRVGGKRPAVAPQHTPGKTCLLAKTKKHKSRQ